MIFKLMLPLSCFTVFLNCNHRKFVAEDQSSQVENLRDRRDGSLFGLTQIFEEREHRQLPRFQFFYCPNPQNSSECINPYNANKYKIGAATTLAPIVVEFPKVKVTFAPIPMSYIVRLISKRLPLPDNLPNYGIVVTSYNYRALFARLVSDLIKNGRPSINQEDIDEVWKHTFWLYADVNEIADRSFPGMQTQDLQSIKSFTDGNVVNCLPVFTEPMIYKYNIACELSRASASATVKKLYLNAGGLPALFMEMKDLKKILNGVIAKELGDSAATTLKNVVTNGNRTSPFIAAISQNPSQSMDVDSVQFEIEKIAHILDLDISEEARAKFQINAVPSEK